MLMTIFCKLRAIYRDLCKHFYKLGTYKSDNFNDNVNHIFIFLIKKSTRTLLFIRFLILKKILINSVDYTM